MLDGHLQVMVRGRVRFVVIAIVVFTVTMIGIVSGNFRNCKVNAVEMSFRQEMDVNEIELEYESQRRQHTKPFTSRGRFCGSSAPRFATAN